MKLLSYSTRAGPRAGFLVKDRVFDLAKATSNIGTPLPADMGRVLSLEEASLSVVRRAAEDVVAKGRTGLSLSEVELAAPVPRPSKILALAGNYQAHLREGGGQVVDRDNSTPRVFIKPVTTCNHHQGVVRIPQRSNAVDYEIELGVVIGKRCRYVHAEDALSVVAGYTVFNDISARKLVISENRTPRTGDSWFDWLNGKWFDTFAPMGPYLVTADEVGDPQSLGMRLWVNGELRQDANTSQMIFGVAELLEWITQFVTLEPGDVIATGTPAGVGSASQTYLQPGDVVEAEIEKVGRLVNSIEKEE